MRVPSANACAFGPIGSGASASGLAISHSISRIRKPDATIVTLLRCCRLQPAGQTERVYAMVVSPAVRAQWSARPEPGTKEMSERDHLQRMSSPNHFFEIVA